MKKYGNILAVLAVLSALSITVAWRSWVSDKSVSQETRIEDAIILRDIEMESDVPPAETEEMAEGSVIHDDDFFKGAGTEEKEVKKVPRGEELLAKMRKKDPRWHLVPYSIKKNDNLWKLSKRLGVGYKIIIGLNDINDPDMLSPGKTIEVPSRKGVYHLVKKGDTLSGMASKYRVNAKTIVAHNGLKKETIRVNRRLFIPGAEAPPDEASRIRNKSGVEEARVKRQESPDRKQSSALAGGIRFIWPVSGRITSGFGNRRDPFSGKRSFHCGIDIGANNGTPIVASAGGRVIFSGWKERYGNLIVLRHEGGYITVYAHNSTNSVKEDDVVAAGSVIGYTGNTGAVTGPHLHFEIRKGAGYPLNPRRMIR